VVGGGHALKVRQCLEQCFFMNNHLHYYFKWTLILQL